MAHRAVLLLSFCLVASFASADMIKASEKAKLSEMKQQALSHLHDKSLESLADSGDLAQLKAAAARHTNIYQEFRSLYLLAKKGLKTLPASKAASMAATMKYNQRLLKALRSKAGKAKLSVDEFNGGKMTKTRFQSLMSYFGATPYQYEGGDVSNPDQSKWSGMFATEGYRIGYPQAGAPPPPADPVPVNSGESSEDENLANSLASADEAADSVNTLGQPMDEVPSFPEKEMTDAGPIGSVQGSIDPEEPNAGIVSPLGELPEGPGVEAGAGDAAGPTSCAFGGEHFCGDGPGDCFCDDLCESFSDCCEDYHEVC